MRIPMADRRTLVKTHAKAYQRGSKGEKSQILDVFVAMTGMNRTYAARILHHHGRRVEVKPGLVVQGDVTRRSRPPRGKTYGPELVKPLSALWEMADYVCGKRLVAVLPSFLAALERHGELTLESEVRMKLERMSAATIDRLLAPEKKRLSGRGRSRTKPGSVLKSRIPVRTFADWEEDAPGFVEIDLVAHDGGNSEGDFVQTLDVTDVCTGWSEQRAVLNKAQCWVLEAMKDIRSVLPFALQGIDSDNGSEFINQHLFRYCQEESLTFTRGRPYRKNDTCYVEQKNYSIVRRAVGYGRFEGEAAVAALNDLYLCLSLRTNFLLPSMKCIGKERVGSKVRRKYDAPRTPFERVLEAGVLDPVAEKEWREFQAALNPAGVHREIDRLSQIVQQRTRKIVLKPVAPKPRMRAFSGRSAPSPPERSARRKLNRKGDNTHILSR